MRTENVQTQLNILHQSSQKLTRSFCLKTTADNSILTSTAHEARQDNQLIASGHAVNMMTAPRRSAYRGFTFHEYLQQSMPDGALWHDSLIVGYSLSIRHTNSILQVRTQTPLGTRTGIPRIGRTGLLGLELPSLCKASVTEHPLRSWLVVHRMRTGMAASDSTSLRKGIEDMRNSTRRASCPRAIGAMTTEPTAFIRVRSSRSASPYHFKDSA